MNIRESYDSAAERYAEHLANELEQKPLDRHLLNRFAEGTRGRGLVGDFGCGPGHVTRYLHDQGVTVMGLDLSPEMGRVAMNLHPGLEFRVDDMTRPQCADASLAGMVLFYSIVHFDASQLGPVFEQARRVLIPGGLALVSFHVGTQMIHRDELFDAPVSLDFHFHVPATVVEALESTRLTVIEHIEREPYEAEYPSRRCYLLAKAV